SYSCLMTTTSESRDSGLSAAAEAREHFGQVTASGDPGRGRGRNSCVRPRTKQKSMPVPILLATTSPALLPAVRVPDCTCCCTSHSTRTFQKNIL
ncbi:hypothetical protein NDU88_004031, partial [Pleurodeles waltl]